MARKRQENQKNRPREANPAKRGHGAGKKSKQAKHLKQSRGAPAHTAILRVTARGVGFAELEHPPQGGPETARIERESLNTGLHRDRVEIAMHPRTGADEQTGEITRVLFRYKKRFVGVIQKTSGGVFVAPDDQKMYEDILLEKKDAARAKKGEKVYAEITKWTDPKLPPLGKVIKTLGKKGDHEVEMEAVVLEQGLAHDFPKSVKEEAQKMPRTISEKEIASRRDMRDVPTFTIDPKTAKDFDDALSVQKLPNGDLEVGIHIADVTHYVRPGSAIDTEAAQRATSIYLVDRTIPMLPEVLSEDLCSLNPKEDKLAFSAIFTLSGADIQKGAIKVLDEWFGRTIIYSSKRFTYEEAQEVIDSGTGTMATELSALKEAGNVLRKARFKDGAIAFEKEEVEFELDEKGRPIDVHVKPRLETSKMIEDFMLLANKRVAEYISKKDKHVEQTFVYRVHDLPDADKLRELAAFLKTLGYDAKIDPNDPRSKDINALLERIRGTAEEGLIQMAAIRSMARAVYSTKNIGHFGLSFAHYTHFTSPIRRYPDMMVHRLLATYLKGEKPQKGALVQYEAASRYASEMEQSATTAERNSIKYKQVEYMSTRIGKIFTGTISGVVKWGLYVEENESKSEGLIHIKNLDDDFYTLDEKTYSLRGERTKKKYRLGDEVKVRVKDADLDKRMIDYELA